jgi:hypothetical protein
MHNFWQDELSVNFRLRFFVHFNETVLPTSSNLAKKNTELDKEICGRFIQIYQQKNSGKWGRPFLNYVFHVLILNFLLKKTVQYNDLLEFLLTTSLAKETIQYLL